ncbi:MAG: hypothetical protein ACODAU_00435 [Myxococcota bacterium]
MSALASLLVRDQIVSVRKIEEAIQRQVISGGDLDTVLLEMGAAPENTLAGYRAAVYGLPPLDRQRVMEVPAEVVRLVPREVAEQHRMVPVATDGATLMVAVSEPPAAADLEQVGELVGHALELGIVTEARLSMALAHHYGVEVAPRIRRLQRKLDEREAGEVARVTPAGEGRVDAGRLVVPSKDAAREAERMLSEPPPPEGRTTQRFGFVAAPEPAPGSEAGARVGVQRVVGVGEPRQTAPLVPAEEAPPESPAPEGAKAPGEPLTAQAAMERLEAARSRDDILEAFFAFARGQLDYVALFVVHDEIAEGRSAAGEGASTEGVRRMAVPLDAAGSFAEVRRTAGPKLTRLDGSEADRKVAEQLGRAKAQPSILVPVSIRQRTVLILYGDRAGSDFGFSEVADLLALTSNVGNAFERLIMRRKFQGYEAAQRTTGEARVRPAQLGTPARASRPSRASWSSPSPAQTASGSPSEEAQPAPVAPSEVTRPAPSAPSEASPSGGAPRPEAARDTAVGPTWSSPPSRPRSVRSARRTVMGLPAADLTKDSWGAQDRASAPAPPREPGPQPEAKSGRRPQAFTVLGVPRSAPPPPASQQGDPAPGSHGRDTVPDMPPAAVDSEPSPARAPVDDDEPELTIEYGDEEDAELAALEDYEAEADASSADAESVRRDPRRDDPDGEPQHDVVRLGRAAAAAAASITRQSQPPSTSQPPTDPDPGEPSVIVDMGGSVEALVRELALSGPDDDAALVSRVLTQGEAALPVLVQYFPGPLWFDRHRPYRRLPGGRDVSPIARAIVAFGERAVPYVSSLLGARDGDTRFYAVLLAGDLFHPDLVEPLGRLVWDPDPGVRSLALDLLPRFAPYGGAYERLLEQLRVFGRVPRKNPVHRAQAVEALGRLGDGKSLDLLVKLLDDDEAPTAQAAQGSLVALTGQDFGASQRRWAAWAEKNRDRHRIEWLIDALAHPEEARRAAVGEELQRVTQQYFGYHSALSKREREVAQRRYREWWETEGRSRFEP